MTMGGLHLLSGLVFASFIRNEKYKEAKWGIVWGSIFPDIDILASIIIFLFTWDLNSAIFIHRSVTHGFFAMGLIVLIGIIVSQTRKDSKYLLFSVAFAFGMLTHTFYDLLDWEVAILAPFTFTRYSITGFNFQTSIEDTYLKVWNALDGLSDIIFYLLLWYWVTHKINISNEQIFGKKLLYVSFISIGYFSALLALAFTNISVELHLILVYAYWGIIHLPLSTVIVQIKMKETIQDFSFLRIRK
ncbi:MAG: metal-dependent hydrolase [Promethearchaeota archaeon]